MELNKEQTIVNYEGAKAYRMQPEQELYSAVVTAGLSNTFYEKTGDRLGRIRQLIGKCTPEFVAKLAVYARNEMYLRSVPLVLTVELAKQHSGTSIVQKAVGGVVKRADEVSELLIYYQMANRRGEVKKLNQLSKQIQKGLSIAFNRFDEYQFAKYNTKSAVSLRDALFLVHPKSKDNQQQILFDKIASNSLSTPYTWETELSELGKQVFADGVEKGTAFTKKWEELIDSSKLGYMALLRNIRNIVEAQVSATHIEKVCTQLSDKEAVLKSKQLPFRFLAAYREIKEIKSGWVPSLLNVLEEAVMHSANNIKGFDSNTSVLLACDVSGSMRHAISTKSKILLYDIGLMLSMLLQSQCKQVVSGMFGDTWKVIHVPQTSILANVSEYYTRAGEVGYATNGHLVIDDLICRHQIIDKVMLFTDLQLWNSYGKNASIQHSWEQYKQIAPQARLYLFDLSGFGQLPLSIKANDVYLIAGWSDKIFEVLDSIENGAQALTRIHETIL